MSRHWLAMQQTSIGDSTTSIDDLLSQLTRTRPALAKEFARIDWGKVVHAAARKALERVAAEFTLELNNDFQNTDGVDRNSVVVSGEWVGVLRARQ